MTGLAQEPSLLPCPFCGSSEIYFEGSTDCANCVTYSCGTCGVHSNFGTKAEALRAWNTRAPLPSEVSQ